MWWSCGLLRSSQAGAPISFPQLLGSEAAGGSRLSPFLGIALLG